MIPVASPRCSGSRELQVSPLRFSSAPGNPSGFKPSAGGEVTGTLAYTSGAPLSDVSDAAVSQELGVLLSEGLDKWHV
jgi:hypothetical protein